MLVHIIARRLVSLIFVLLGVTLITFALSHLIPADPARIIAGDRAGDEVVAAIRQQLGLDLPVWQQYGRYLGQVLTGDLGTSLRSGGAIATELAQVLPATLELALSALGLTVLVGIPLGIAAALRRGGWPDHAVRLLALAGHSTPSFWLGTLLISLFYVVLDLLPAGGRLSPGLTAPDPITGLLLIDTLLTGKGALFADALLHLLLPASTLALLAIGTVARITRASLLDVLSQDHVRTARAFGLPERVVITRYALRTALIPVVTSLGLLLGDLLSGAVVTEIIFAWPGLGTYMVSAVSALDFPAIMGFTVLMSLAYVLCNLLVDLSYLALDPRIKDLG